MCFAESEAAALFNALSDPNRIRIMQLLLEGEKNAATLLEQLDISQPTLSYHMRLLCGSGLVSSRKSGTWVFYSVNTNGGKKAIRYIAELTGLPTE